MAFTTASTWLRRIGQWLRLRPRAQGPATAVSGLWGEAAAERLLKQAGYRILGRRVRVGERDELDLVARDGEVLVFVEVKTRKSEAFGSPVAAVDRRKRRVLSRAIVRYLRGLHYRPLYFRCDVVEVIGQPGDSAPTLRHIPNAFNLDPRYRLPF